MSGVTFVTLFERGFCEFAALKKIKIWHAKRRFGTVNSASTVRFDSMESVAGLVGPDGQLSGVLFSNVGGMLVKIFGSGY